MKASTVARAVGALMAEPTKGRIKRAINVHTRDTRDAGMSVTRQDMARARRKLRSQYRAYIGRGS